MRHIYLFFLFLSLLACNKDEKRLAEEEILIQTYAQQQGLNLQRHESGFYYLIDTLGRPGQNPQPNTYVEVRYKGYLLDGSVFASTGTNSEWLRLQDMIYGWQLALPLIGPQGRIRFFLPSFLGYGAKGLGSVIPPYSILVFEVDLVEIHPHF
jgi:FKBP-type peptidyl-prolyl cis-trans isomerase FklB